MKYLKCNVCGSQFVPKRDQIYQAQERLGITQSLSQASKIFDVIDCPTCGCQVILSVRMPRVKEGEQ